MFASSQLALFALVHASKSRRRQPWYDATGPRDVALANGDIDFDSLTFGDRLLWEVWLNSPALSTISMADEVGLPALLSDAGATASDLVEHLWCDLASIEAILSVLYSLGVLLKDERRFYLSDTARKYLLPDSPFYCGQILKLCRIVPFTFYVPASETDSTKRPSISDEEVGSLLNPGWSGESSALALARAATGLMYAHSFPETIMVARRGDFRSVRRLLDVAGGSGCFGVSLAQCYPNLHSTVLELPFVCEITRDYVGLIGLSNRVAVEAGDAFAEPWPEGHDAVFLSNLFHDWSIDSLGLLIGKGFASLPSGGRIYVHVLLLKGASDTQLSPTSLPAGPMISRESRRLSTSELTRILIDAGFVDIKVTSTNDNHLLLSAVKC